MPRRLPHGASHAMPTPKSTLHNTMHHSHAHTHTQGQIIIHGSSRCASAISLSRSRWLRTTPGQYAVGGGARKGRQGGEGVGVDESVGVGQGRRTPVLLTRETTPCTTLRLINFRECIRQDRQDRQDREGSGWGSTQCLILAPFHSSLQASGSVSSSLRGSVRPCVRV